MTSVSSASAAKQLILPLQPWVNCVELSRAEELVKAERGDISELMTTSFSETRTTEELVPAESEEEKDDEEEEEKAFQNRPYPPRIGITCAFNEIFRHFHNYRLHKIIVLKNKSKRMTFKACCLAMTAASS